MQQYAWRSVFEKNANGTWQPIEDKFYDPQAETGYCLSTDSQHRYVHYDSRYDDSGCRTSSDHHTKVCGDAPSSWFGHERPKSAQLKSIAHFDTFFVVNGRACAQVSWLRTSDWTRSFERPAKLIVEGGRILTDENVNLSWRKIHEQAQNLASHGGMDLEAECNKRPTLTERIEKRIEYAIDEVIPDGLLNLRLRPDPNSPILTEIEAGSRGVYALGDVQNYGEERWYKVEAEGKSGWVNSRYMYPVQEE
jgi:hypothetical protein